MITIEREKLERALAALEATIDVPCYGGHPKQEAAAVAIKEALAQPEQEPVALPHRSGNWCIDLTCSKCYSAEFRFKHTTPQQRPWVGLTDDEIKEIVGPYGDTPIKGYTRKLFNQIEAKLKEKNT